MPDSNTTATNASKETLTAGSHSVPASSDALSRFRLEFASVVAGSGDSAVDDVKMTEAEKGSKRSGQASKRQPSGPSTSSK